jgi:hypothetical protein
VKKLCRVVAIIVVMFGLFAVAIIWGLPIVTSIQVAKKALPGSRAIPRELDDHSVSNAPGAKLSYFGREFQLPWDDIDEAKTELYPKENPTRVILTFRSGLRVSFSKFPPKEFVNGLGKSFGMSPQRAEAAFGNDDYEFLRALYEVTPDKMHRWSLSSEVHARETILVTIKSISLMPSAKDGIFRVQNDDYRGFQQGSPQLRSKGIVVDLYSSDGGVEILFSQNDYKNPAGLTQAEINRVVQSVRKGA